MPYDATLSLAPAPTAAPMRSAAAAGPRGRCPGSTAAAQRAVARYAQIQPDAAGAREPGPAAAQEPFPLGAHLLTSRWGYRHHGIYVGDGRVIHYAGLSSLWRCGPVEEVTLEQFADGHPVWIKLAGLRRYTPAQIVARARSRLGENCYCVANNNCEHLCEWCVDGEARSAQVDTLLAWPPVAFLRRWLQGRRRASVPAGACAV